MSHVLRQLRQDEFLRTLLTEEQKALYISDPYFHHSVNMTMETYLNVEEKLPLILRGYEAEALAQRAAHIVAAEERSSTALHSKFFKL